MENVAMGNLSKRQVIKAPWQEKVKSPTDHVLDAMIIRPFHLGLVAVYNHLTFRIFRPETLNGSYEAGQCIDALLTHFSQILHNFFTLFLHPAKYFKIATRGGT